MTTKTTQEWSNNDEWLTATVTATVGEDNATTVSYELQADNRVVAADSLTFPAVVDDEMDLAGRIDDAVFAFRQTWRKQYGFN